jgi:hypothetical protein
VHLTFYINHAFWCTIETLCKKIYLFSFMTIVYTKVVKSDAKLIWNPWRKKRSPIQGIKFQSQLPQMVSYANKVHIEINIRDYSLFMTEGGLAKKGGGSWSIFDRKRGGDLKILVQKGGPVIYYSGIILEKILTCNYYCYHRERTRQQIKFMYS